MEVLMKKRDSLFQGKKPPLIACVITDTDVHSLDKGSLDVADVIELRVDMFEDIAVNHVTGTFDVAKSKFNKPIIATVRDIREGGAREIADRLELYKSTITMSDLIDVEINSTSLFSSIREILNGKLLIGSYHNFQSTPDDNFLDNIEAKGREAGVDIVKVAVTANNRDDLIRLMHFTLRHKGKGIITMSMGEEGALSRIIAPVFGSLITYGFVNKPSAPGQLSISQLFEVFKLIKLR
jgi:3-dehydroquinate dehydratase-1